VRTSRSIRRPAVALACTAVLVAVALAPAAQAAPKLKLGFYDCYGYNYGSGFLDYKGSVRLLKRKRYEHSFGREGRKMVDKTTGRYRVRGKRVTFIKGAMAGTPGLIDTPSAGARKDPYFHVLVDGRKSGVTCTLDRTP
jgi:hypothetical protein